MCFQHSADRRAVPSEDEVLDGLARPDAARAKHGDALATLAADAIVGDSIGALVTEIGAELLRAGVVGGRVHGFEFALPGSQVVEVRAAHWSVEYLEVEVLRRRARRFQKRDAVMPHLLDRRRLIPRRVVHAERWSAKREKRVEILRIS